MPDQRLTAVILAAGKGTRLKSDVPKVLHEVCGRPMLAYVFDACRQAGIQKIIAVIGHGKDQVRATFAGDRDVTWVEQNEQKGTGHAVMVCREELAGRFDHTLILGGDGPLIRAKTIRELIARHLQAGCAGTLATAIIDDPTGYGRIDRDAAGTLRGIVEHGDCTPGQRAIREVNPSYYCFRVPELLAVLQQVRPNNSKGEYYVTDVVGLLLAAGQKVEAITSVPPGDIFSINSRRELAMVSDVMRQRILNELMDGGVTVVDPRTTWIDSRAAIGVDTIIEPHVVISGPAAIGRNCRIGPFAHLSGGVRVADGACVAAFSGVRG
ncbi:Bifunctional protein GlmU [Phycisphaerae bacterium RAS1]|nr:Bifunctional protein GlmU [Phycisphaerae bacterium RAS1]